MAFKTDVRKRFAAAEVPTARHAVYATEGYEQSVTNMARTSLATDNVFSDDGGARQLGATSGDVATGFSVQLTVPV